MVFSGQVLGIYYRIINGILLPTVLACCTGLAGCSGSEDQARPVAEVVHTYTVRGRIVSLPSAEDPASELRIHHEAIDLFKSGSGEPAPMKAMTMTFPPAEGVSLEGLKVGDAVQFEFKMQWEPSVSMSAASISKLPPETKLDIDTDAAGGSGVHTGH